MGLKFRKDKVDVVFLFEEDTPTKLREKIVAVGVKHIMIDLQYAVCYRPVGACSFYSALILAKKK